MNDSERHLAQTEERLGNALLELEKVKGKYAALNSAYTQLLNVLFDDADTDEEGRHIFYSADDIH